MDGESQSKDNPLPPPRSSEASCASGSLSKEPEDKMKELEQLKLCYELLNGAMCFLLKRKITPKVETVIKLMMSLNKGTALTSEDLLSIIRKIIKAAPHLFKLHYAPHEPAMQKATAAEESTTGSRVFWYDIENVRYCLEIDFLKYRGTGKGHCDQRRKAVFTALGDLANTSDASFQECQLPFQPGIFENKSAEVAQNEALSQAVKNAESEQKAVTKASSNNLKIRRDDGTVDFDRMIEVFENSPFYKDQIVHRRIYPAKSASYGSLSFPLPSVLTDALRMLSITEFYQHQVKAIDFLRKPVKAAEKVKGAIICTSTSSGKSLIYNVPVLESILQGKSIPCEEGKSSRRCTALYLFPTKALAQDQLRSLDGLCEHLSAPINKYTYDGDTCQTERSQKRNDADIIITNPDMLHVSILPSNKSWSTFFENLEFVVLDEAHTYYGAFGSHVACVLRRLIRICSKYKDASASPTCLKFICCSATIGNPLELFKLLVPGIPDDSICLVSDKDDSSSAGEKRIILWNPPLLDAPHEFASQSVKKSRKNSKNALSESSSEQVPDSAAEIHLNNDKREAKFTVRRKSSIFETAIILAALIRLGVKVLAFARTRKLTELVLKYSQDLLKNGYAGQDYRKDNQEELVSAARSMMTSRSEHLVQLISGYRGGYRKHERRQIEVELFGGKLTGVVATNALELGIDVGHLDVVVMLGFPGSVASMWQQLGRAGRAGRASLAIMVCFDGPLDHYWIDHPDHLFDKTAIEGSVLDPCNHHVLNGHLLCAGSEQALSLCKTNECTRENKLWCDCCIFCPKEKLQVEIKKLVDDNLLRFRGIFDISGASCERLIYETHSKLARPFNNVNLRTIDPATIKLVDDAIDPGSSGKDNVLDSIPYSRAFFEVYPGAVYLHQAQTFLITKLDLDKFIAHAHKANLEYFTSPRDLTEVNILGVFESCESKVGGFNAHIGTVNVTRTVWGYRKMWFKNNRVFEMHEFTLPPLEYETVAVWLDIPVAIRDAVVKKKLDWQAGLHAASHVLCAISTSLVIFHSSGIETEHISPYAERPRPRRLLLYDTTPGGIGITEALFKKIDTLVERANNLLQECTCKEGCMKCILSMTCSEYNSVLNKEAAKIILSMLMSKKRRLEVDTSEASSSVDEIDGKPLPTTPEKKRAKAMIRAKAMGRAKTEQYQISKPWRPHLEDSF